MGENSVKESFVERVDHINIVVKDLDKVESFFVSLGFMQEDPISFT